MVCVCVCLCARVRVRARQREEVARSRKRREDGLRVGGAVVVEWMRHAHQKKNYL